MVRKKQFQILLFVCLLFIAPAFFSCSFAYLNNPYDDRIMDQWGWLAIYADVAYANGYRGTNSTIVAVIDTGIDLDHPDLVDNLYTNPSETANGVDDDNNSYVDDIHGWNFVDDTNDTSDHDGHGSHCAGIIAANDNAIGICGVAPDVKILPIKVIESGSGDLDELVDAIAYARIMGASVISMSIGADPDSVGGGLRILIDAEILLAHLAEIVLVAAAGNTDPVGIQEIMYPACNEYVISVGATTKSNTKAFYSNYGPEIDIAAPGGDTSGAIISTYNESNYKNLGGTSMACPHVSGVVALMLQWNGTLTADEVRARINDTAIDLGTTGWDEEFGHGLINAAGCLGLPMDHTYNPILDWIIRNMWWILLLGVIAVLAIIFNATKKPYR